MSGNETSKGARSLDDRIGAALSSWPLPDRDDAAWEVLAARIEARVAEEGAGGSDGGLLDAPHPALPGESAGTEIRGAGTLDVELARRGASSGGESKMSQPPERTRDRVSLKDLAKLASAPSLTPNPPPSKASASLLSGAPKAEKAEGDSGVIDLKQMAAQDPGAEERAKSTKLASNELFADEAPRSAPASVRPSSRAPEPSKTEAKAPASVKPPPSSSARPSSAPAASSPSVAAGDASRAEAPPSSAVAARPAPSADEEKKGSLTWIFGGGALLAAAAAAIFMLRSPGAPAPSPTAAPHAQAAEPPMPKARPAPHPAESAVAEAPAEAPAGDPGVNPAALPSPTPPTHAAAGGKALAAGPKKAVTVADTPKAAEPPNPALVVKDLPASPTGGFNDALRQAAGPTENAGGEGVASSKPKIDPGSVPQQPSSGAIVGGVSAAMAEARSCLGLDDPISRVAITFESGGTVSSVAVSGFAAGKPAEACIKAAIKKAKVPPFAQPTYTQTLTVRPNS